jgi:hypothetical protein
VSTAVPLLATTISFLLPSEFLEHDVELFEPVVPQLLVRRDPVVNRLQRAAVQAIHPAPAVLTDLDEPDLAQDAQVLGDLRLGDPEPGDQIVDRPLATGKKVKDLPPAGLGHGVERVRRRRCSCHVEDCIPI